PPDFLVRERTAKLDMWIINRSSVQACEIIREIFRRTVDLQVAGASREARDCIDKNMAALVRCQRADESDLQAALERSLTTDILVVRGINAIRGLHEFGGGDTVADQLLVHERGRHDYLVQHV